MARISLWKPDVSTFFEEVTGYIGFGADDHQRLRALHPVLAPHFPAVADELYETIEAIPGASAIVGGLHEPLIDWMSSGLLGPWDEPFYDQRARIGRQHVEIGLPQHYIFTAMNIVRTAYIERVSVLFAPCEAFPIIRSINKLLDIELAVMQHTCQLDSERRLVVRERRQHAEQRAAMQTLSSGLAHELRNPLNSAKLQLEVLERRLRRQFGDPRFAEPSALARHEIERLTALVTDFLAFAQPPAMAPELHDVIAIVERVLELERPLAEHRGVELALVAKPTSILARIDSAKVHKVIQNLVRNAVEAVSPGGHVEVRVAVEADRVHVCVDDDGPGIPDRVRARMFEPFFSTKDCGTGLGMSIVHSLVTMHGGTIDVASTPAGTHFDVALPRAA